MANQPMDDFIRDQAKASVAVKQHAKSNVLLYLKTVALQKAFGPLYRSWLNLKAGMIAVVKLVPGLETGFMGIAGAATVLTKPLKAVTKSLSSIKTVMLFLTGIMLSIMGVMLLVAGSFSKAGEQFPIFSENLQRIKGAVGGVIDRFTELFEYFQSADFAPTGDALMEVFTSIANLVSEITATVIEVLSQLMLAVLSLDFTPLITLVQFVVDEIAVLWGIIEEQNWGILLSAAEGVLESIADLFTSVGESAEDGLGGVIPLMESLFDFILGTGITVLTGLLNILSDVIDAVGEVDFSPVVDAVKAVGAELTALGAIILGLDWAGLFSAASDALNSVLGLLGDVADAATSGVGGALDSLNQAFADVAELAIAYFTGVVSLFGDLVDKIGEADFSGLTAIITAVAGAVSTLATGILGLDWSGLSSAAVSVFGEILSVISSVLSTGEAFFGDFLDTIVDVFLTLADAWVENAGVILESVASVIAIFGGLDLTPILTPIMALFMIFAGLITDFGVAFFTMIGGLFTHFTTLMTYLADTGILQALIDIIGNLGMAAVMIIGSIVGALDNMGINFGSIFGLITNVVGGFVEFLNDSGILDYFAEVLTVIGLIIQVVGLLVAGAISLIGKLVGYLAGPAWTIFSGIIGAVIGIVAGIMKTLLPIFIGFFRVIGVLLETFVLLLTEGPGAAVDFLFGKFGDLKDWIFGIFGDIGDFIGGIFDGVIEGIGAAVDWMIKPFQDLYDEITDLMDSLDLGGALDSVTDAAGGIWESATGWFTGALGGIASGPTSGFPAILHGTEAVVPLPDGRSIPVNLTGAIDSDSIVQALTGLRKDFAKMDRGGDVITLNIGVKGARGNPDEIAMAVSREVQKVFRTRARSGGFGRGF